MTARTSRPRPLAAAARKLRRKEDFTFYAAVAYSARTVPQLMKATKELILDAAGADRRGPVLWRIYGEPTTFQLVPVILSVSNIAAKVAGDLDDGWAWLRREHLPPTELIRLRQAIANKPSPYIVIAHCSLRAGAHLRAALPKGTR